MRRFMFVLGCGLAAMTTLGCGDDEGSSGSGGERVAGPGGSGGTGGAATGGGGATSSDGGGGMAAGGAGGGGEDCAPEPMDDECTACGKANCCEEGLACFADTECSACLSCLQTSPDGQDCFPAPCDFMDAETQAFLECSQTCAAVCM